MTHLTRVYIIYIFQKIKFVYIHYLHIDVSNKDREINVFFKLSFLSVLFDIKINKSFRLDNASNLTYEFLYDNFKTVIKILIGQI